MTGVNWKSIDEVTAHERAKFANDDALAASEVNSGGFLTGLYERFFIQRVNDWRPAESLKVLWSQVDRLAPRRNRDSDGMIGDASHQTRDSDHNPWVRDNGVGVVTALDITDDPRNGCSAQRLVDALCASRDARIKYIIWNQRIANSSAIDGSPAWAWRVYDGENPHTAHFHISVLPSKPLYDSQSAWAISAGVSAALLAIRVDTALYDRPNGTPFESLFAGQTVRKIEVAGPDWVKVEIGSIQGYVMTAMLNPPGVA